MKLDVQEYYGTILKTSADLQTNACCEPDNIPESLKIPLSNIHSEVSAKYYGCGLLAPRELKGLRILDLGSGSGRDCYALAQLVGTEGSVLGIDMTDEQLQTANQYKEWHAEKFGFANVEFLKGDIERLDALGLKDNSFDLIISNCVVNLSTDKEAVFRQAHRLLKNGGEMYFSDVYSERRIPETLAQDPVLYGECLSGALYWNDFLNLAKRCGFADPRLVESRPLTIENPELETKLGNHRFYSATYRLFKIEDLEPACEDYGQAVRYKGTMSEGSLGFLMDQGHYFEKGKIEPVCGNSWRMLHETRFQKHFDFFGDWSTHFGIFEGCGTTMPFSSTIESTGSESCC